MGAEYEMQKEILRLELQGRKMRTLKDLFSYTELKPGV